MSYVVTFVKLTQPQDWKFKHPRDYLLGSLQRPVKGPVEQKAGKATSSHSTEKTEALSGHIDPVASASNLPSFSVRDFQRLVLKRMWHYVVSGLC